MRGVLLFILSSSVHSCWFYSKEHAVENIRTMMHRDGVNFIDRKYLREKTKHLPGPFRWTVDQFGVEHFFSDCDVDKNGMIFMHETESSECLDSCVELGALNIFCRL